MHRKKLQKISDVVYNVDEGIITDIPGLHYRKNKFTLKRNGKKATTQKYLSHVNKKN